MKIQKGVPSPFIEIRKIISEMESGDSVVIPDNLSSYFRVSASKAFSSVDELIDNQGIRFWVFEKKPEIIINQAEVELAILEKLNARGEITMGVLCNLLRSIPKDIVESSCISLESAGKVKKYQKIHSKTKKTIVSYAPA